MATAVMLPAVTADTPGHVLLALALTAEIFARHYQPGDLFPNAHEIARTHDTSSAEAARARAVLHLWGLLTPQANGLYRITGTRPRQPGPASPVLTNTPSPRRNPQ